MRNMQLIPVSICLILSACHNQPVKESGKAKEEIAKADADFEKMAAGKGIAEAFYYYADSNAVIKRSNDTLITGKENIKHYYDAGYFKTASVSWSPDFIEVAANADLGYTFGKYTWRSKDSTGRITENTGVFHTVWKKQTDGSWKYVWD
jgi:ketosteroid isomerase-like protein